MKEAISSVDLREKIKKIADKNKLHIDQAGNLENETMLVMLGLEPTDDYKENIRRELNITRDRAQAVTADVDKEIFSAIRESLRKITEEDEVPDNDQKDSLKDTRQAIQYPPLDESEEIQQQIREQQEVKPVAPLPPNLPTGEPNGEARPLSGEKKPIHIAPYREPIE